MKETMVFDTQKEMKSKETSPEMIHKAVAEIHKHVKSAYPTSATFSMAADAIQTGSPILFVEDKMKPAKIFCDFEDRVF